MASSRSGSPTPRTSSAGHSLAKHVFHAIEQVPLVLRVVARSRLEVFLRQRLGELFEQLPLILRQLPRRLDLHGREEVAAAAAADLRHPFSAHTQRRAGLRALGHLYVLGAVE